MRHGGRSQGETPAIYLALTYIGVVKGETATPGTLLPAKLRAAVPLGHGLVQEELETLNGDRNVVFLWLCQSQSQAGTASAVPLDVNAKPNRFRVALQPLGNLGCGRRRDADQAEHPQQFYYTPYGIILLLSAPIRQRGLNDRGLSSDTT